jgi:prepilin-type processing-associated H-X9-DG protein
MSTNPYKSPDTVSPPLESKSSVLKRRLWGWLISFGIIGLIVALLLPARRTAREPARRAQCSNQLKNIALGLHNYQDVYGCLPPAYTVDAAGKRLHSWRTLILPYMEQKALYEKIDLSKPWNDPVNREAFETPVSGYHCPSMVDSPTHTPYFAIVGVNSCFPPTEPRKLADITDDHSQTLMVVEVGSELAVPWMSPTDVSEQEIVSFTATQERLHPGGMQTAYVDGHVQFLSNKTSAATIRALVSVAGHDEADIESDD